MRTDAAFHKIAPLARSAGLFSKAGEVALLAWRTATGARLLPSALRVWLRCDILFIYSLSHLYLGHWRVRHRYLESKIVHLADGCRFIVGSMWTTKVTSQIAEECATPDALRSVCFFYSQLPRLAAALLCSLFLILTVLVRHPLDGRSVDTM